LGVTKSTSKNCNEFVVHIKDSFDNRYKWSGNDSVKNMAEMLTILQNVYYNACGKNLPIYGVDDESLESYET
jgi:hypothetical protein